jgi:5-formyltetrahydrofolate cyclo-ligase
MNSISAAKTELRQSLTLARNLQHSLINQELAVGFAGQLISLCNNYSVSCIAAYLSFGTEPDTTEFLNWARTSEVQVMLPISRTDGELDWVYQSHTETTPGIFGFAEAVGEAADFSDAQVIIMPALAVDRNGNRLGKGKGFYDRSINSNSAYLVSQWFTTLRFSTTCPTNRTMSQLPGLLPSRAPSSFRNKRFKLEANAKILLRLHRVLARF